jgi:biopolymer transport protein ExbD/biopolymer transport protein TolR
MKRSRGKNLNQEMNLTNMIDVIFAILIVFMIAAPLMNQGVKVSLPKADAPALDNQELLKVSITRELHIYIADQQASLQNFQTSFAQLWDGEVPVVVNADESVQYGMLMKVVTEIQKAGVTQLGFLTGGDLSDKVVVSQD